MLSSSLFLDISLRLYLFIVRAKGKEGERKEEEH